MFAARFPARRSPRTDVPIPATLVVESDGKKARHESQIINVSERGLQITGQRRPKTGRDSGNRTSPR